jgi:hypothetical protein
VTPTRPLDVDADLAVETDDWAGRIEGHGDLIVVDVPSLSAAREIVRTAASFADQLAGADVTVDLRVRGRSVATYGPAVETGPLARALGLAPARVRPGGVLLSLL